MLQIRHVLFILLGVPVRTARERREGGGGAKIVLRASFSYSEGSRFFICNAIRATMHSSMPYRRAAFPLPSSFMSPAAQKVSSRHHSWLHSFFIQICIQYKRYEIIFPKFLFSAVKCVRTQAGSEIYWAVKVNMNERRANKTFDVSFHYWWFYLTWFVNDFVFGRLESLWQPSLDISIDLPSECFRIYASPLLGRLSALL